MRNITNAGILGGVGGAIGSALGFAAIPEHVSAPWWAYVITPVVTSICSAWVAYWTSRGTR